MKLFDLDIFFKIGSTTFLVNMSPPLNLCKFGWLIGRHLLFFGRILPLFIITVAEKVECVWGVDFRAE